uniref:non-specific serine/threonine protein kinase n=1 Tax=Neogobius melanostomus TaxID=47308 RepID=A0A8C6SGV5_9GOBI
MVAEGEGEGGGPQEHRVAPPLLPSIKVSRDVLRSFPHSKRVGSYLVGKMINKGSFAKVMEGLHIGTGEKVAIKVIDKKKARQDSYVLKNMKREPRIHQMVRHPHIVVLFEVRTCSCENDYRSVWRRGKSGYTRQILSAVEHLHKHGIVHRDLKIENFLLDEHNNIKIVDFGLSNTLKSESLSLDLLNTQCGSPAYAAPELLAHRKYGPKVDVWSVGVSTFAMLTGTLPFTVEPFNIKHLHQKMINGEISSIPSDVSKGAVSFVLSLLEPDPAKRPSIRAAMEERWINEGYGKKSLQTLCSKNKLCAEDLNSSVLTYVTDTFGYSLSDVIHTLTNNRPCPVMAYYHLLLNKFSRSQKSAKVMKVSSQIKQKDFASKCVDNSFRVPAVLQCLCSESERWCTCLRLKAPPLSCVTPPPARCPSTPPAPAAPRAPPDSPTCSGPPGQMGRPRTPPPSVSMTAIPKTTSPITCPSVITCPSASAWRSCRRFTPPIPIAPDRPQTHPLQTESPRRHKTPPLLCPVSGT